MICDKHEITTDWTRYTHTSNCISYATHLQIHLPVGKLVSHIPAEICNEPTWIAVNIIMHRTIRHVGTLVVRISAHPQFTPTKMHNICLHFADVVVQAPADVLQSRLIVIRQIAA